MDDLSPGDIRSRTFSTTRRGYERGEVERFQQEVAGRVEALSEELDELRSRLQQLGLDDPKDLKAEFDAVGGEVRDILQSARRAAEEMRSRASSDAARWLADADTAATALRGSAWEMGSELLSQSQAAAEETLRNAEQDALFIRAEAERETLRMTAEARRQAEEERRQAKEEAERRLLDARAESETILANARQSAEAAQERARALEERRSELMKELEAARESIGQMEQEIDSRREALYMAGVNEPSGMRVIAPEGQAEWEEDDAGVRVVPVAQFDSSEPVDADAMADEVRKLRQVVERVESLPEELTELETAASVAATDRPASEPADHPAAEAAPPAAEALEEEVLPDGSDQAPPAAGAGDSSADLSIPAEARPATPGSDLEPVPAGEPSEMAADVEPAGSPDDGTTEAVVPVAVPESGVEEIPSDSASPEPEIPRADPLSGLFASLRTPAPPTAASIPEPEAAAVPVPEDEPPSAADTPAAPAPAEETPERRQAAGPAIVADPFEVRDRLLLPIQNRILRSVKRRLVDLQNLVLEELRVDGARWEPSPPMFLAALADELRPVHQESYVAGFAAATELVGAPAVASPAASTPAGADFVDALIQAVSDALRRARTGNAGSREMASAVSKVFRAWRTDEAERRVRWAARAAYHRGIAAGFASLGIARIEAVAPGRPCGACAAGTGVSWDPAQPVPAGVVLPPASAECAASIVPAAASE